MGNTHQAGIKRDDHGGSRDQQPQAASIAPDQLQAGVKGDDHGGSRDQQPQVVDLDQFQAGAAERARNQLGGDSGGHDFETTSMLKDSKKNSATDGGGKSSMIDILRPATESVILRHDDDPHHLSPPSLLEPDGVEFVLHTLPVMEWCIGDGDGFTAYVKKAVGVAVSGSYKKGDTNNQAPQQYRIRMRNQGAPASPPPSSPSPTTSDLEEMSDDEREFAACNYCGDERGLCDRPHLVEDRRFSIVLPEDFEDETLIPCHARRYVLEKMGFEDHERMETKIIHLRTHDDGYVFAVKLFNSLNTSNFGCRNWEMLCKAYDFHEGMLLTFDLGDADIDEKNMTIWVLVETLPVLPLSYFHSSKNIRKMVDKTTYYNDEAQLTYKEKDCLIAFFTDIENYNNNYGVPQNYDQYKPLVHAVCYGNIHNDSMKIPMDCLPHMMSPSGHVEVMRLRPPRPGQAQFPHNSCPYRISNSKNAMIIKDWKKVFKHRRKLLGSNIVRRPRLGDRMISVLHYGQSVPFISEENPILFYEILPERVE